MKKRVYTSSETRKVGELKKHHRQTEFYIHSPLRYEWTPSPPPPPPQAVKAPPTPPASPPRSPPTKAKPLPVLPPTPERSRTPSPSPPPLTVGSPDPGKTGKSENGATETVLWLECWNCGTSVEPHELEPAAYLAHGLGVGLGHCLGLNLGLVTPQNWGQRQRRRNKPRVAGAGEAVYGGVGLGEGGACRYCIDYNPRKATTYFQSAVLHPEIFTPPSFDSDFELSDDDAYEPAPDDIVFTPEHLQPVPTTIHAFIGLNGLKLHPLGDSAITAGGESNARTDPHDPHSFSLAQLAVQGYNAVVKDTLGEHVKGIIGAGEESVWRLGEIVARGWGREEDEEGGQGGEGKDLGREKYRVTGSGMRGSLQSDDRDEEDEEDGDHGYDICSDEEEETDSGVGSEVVIQPGLEVAKLEYGTPGIEEIGRAVKLVEGMVSGWWGKQW